MRTVGTAGSRSVATRTCAPMSASPGASSNAAERPRGGIPERRLGACQVDGRPPDRDRGQGRGVRRRRVPAGERRLDRAGDRGLERLAHPISRRSGAGRPTSSKPTRRYSRMAAVLSAKTPRWIQSLPAAIASAAAVAVTSSPRPRPRAQRGRPDRREVAQAVEGGPLRDRGGLAAETDEVVREGRVLERGRDLPADARPHRLLDVEGAAQDRGDVVDRRVRRRPARRVQPLQADLGPVASRRTGQRPVAIGQDHDAAHAHVAEPVRDQPRDEVRRLVERGRGPDVRLPAERREQDQGFRQAAVEGVGIAGPAEALEPVPEGLRLVRVEQQQAVAHVAQLAAGGRVDARLMDQEAAHRRLVDPVEVARVVLVHHRWTILAGNRSRCGDVARSEANGQLVASQITRRNPPCLDGCFRSWACPRS